MDDYSNMTIFKYNDIDSRFGEVRKLVKDNSEFITITKDEKMQILINGTRGNPAFRFSISNPVERDKKVIYQVDHAPRSSRSNDLIIHKVDSESVIKVLKVWLALVQTHLSRKGLHPSDKITDQYQKDFQERYFKLLDEDADTNAFGLKQQVLIDSIINHSILELKEAGIDEDDILIKEALDLRANLGKWTKNQVFEKLKIIYPKIVKLGIPILQRITKVCTEAMISSGYNLLVKTLAETLV